MPKNLIVPGNPLSIENDKNRNFNTENYELVQKIEVSQFRSLSNEIELQIDDNQEIIALEFEDGVEWIGPVMEIDEIFHQENPIRSSNSNPEGRIFFPTKIAPKDSDRGLVSIAIKTISIFKNIGKKNTRKKDLLPGLVLEAAKKVDFRQAPEEGIFHLDDNFNLNRNKKPGTNQKFLLFIHGTASNTEGGFKSIKTNTAETPLWSNLRSMYAEHIYAYQHHTLSKDPIDNILFLSNELPKGAEIDIISHSRGGILADILSRYSRDNEQLGFTKDEIEKLEKEVKGFKEKLNALNEAFKKKNIKVNKIVRVASPSAGTTLASKRLDHYLNALMTAIGMVTGIGSSFLYDAVKSLLMKVIEQKANPEALPGIWSMVPDSPIQALLNNQQNEAGGQLYALAGNAEIGKNIGRSLLVILTNLFYRKENDFVVDTNSMWKGPKRTQVVNVFKFDSHDAVHTKYFENSIIQKRIFEALNGEDDSILLNFESLENDKFDRGVILTHKGLGDYNDQEISGEKPIVILLPGIMGSNLNYKDDKVWLSFKSILGGNIEKLRIRAKNDVKASSLIQDFYEPAGQHLREQGYDVYTFPYDWRISVEKSAKELSEVLESLLDKYDKPLYFLAHSMGGIVLRDLIINHPDLWNRYISKEQSKVILGGTPWYGSHLIMETLTGDQRRVKQLALMDFGKTKRDLLEIFLRYEGLYDLLPLKGISDSPEIPFEKSKFWTDLALEVGTDSIIVPSQDELTYFKNRKTNILKADKTIDFSKFWYIAGKSEGTVYGYEIHENWFGKKLKYKKTPNGDGSVVWELGIPEGLPKEHLYYHPQEHATLFKNKSILMGVTSILRGGTPYTLSSLPAAESNRDGSEIRAGQSDPDHFEIGTTDAEVLANIFGSGPSSTLSGYSPPLKISVKHADLIDSDFPVLLGHFKQDNIVSAEAALDKYLDGKLIQRFRTGLYPKEIDENLILRTRKLNNGYAIIAGLGEVYDLTSYQLQNAVRNAALAYSFYIKDNHPEKSGEGEGLKLSSLLLGSGFARLQMEEALVGIIAGIASANENIRLLDSGLKEITEVQIIDYYEDVSFRIYHTLKQLENTQNHLNIIVKEGINKGIGARKRPILEKPERWWMSFSTRMVNKETDYKKSHLTLLYESNSGRAKIDEAEIVFPKEVISNFLGSFSNSPTWNPEVATTLFEMLIPNSFKDVLRAQNNLVWKFDEKSASIPWEMIHDKRMKGKPIFVNTGLIRQLYKPKSAEIYKMISSRSALVIGDPEYHHMKLNQLPGAKKEAELVSQLLKSNHFELTQLINSKAEEIYLSMCNNDFRLLHISGHGIYSPETGEIGVALGNNNFLNPAFFENLSHLPEFVFINCCYSGTIQGLDPKYLKYRPDLAANIGTTLIDQGVKAIIVTGWAVNDNAAFTFANVFYQNFLAGYSFGDAVQMARKECYDAYPTTNTWGAYQCYGDPQYKLVTSGSKSKTEDDFWTREEVVIGYNNLYSDIDKPGKSPASILSKLDKLHEAALRLNHYDCTVIEMEALIYDKLNLIDEALGKYELLRNMETSDFKFSTLESELLCVLRSDVSRWRDEIKTQNMYLDLVSKILEIGSTKRRIELAIQFFEKFAELANDVIKGERLKKVRELQKELKKKYPD